jgi:hypothetical protein
MADGVLSMFMTPEQYQLMQNTAQQQRALQFAQLDPMAQGQYGLFLGGSQLGGAIGRGLGGEDRQLKLISQRQALSQNIDPSNPESILKVAQEASRLGDQQFALSLSDYARNAASEIALAKQRLEERRNAIAPDIQVAQYKAKLSNGIAALKDATDPESIAQREALQRELDGLPTKGADSTNEIKNAESLALQKGARGTPEFNAEFSAQLSRLTTKEGGKPTKVGISQATGDAVFQDPTSDRLFTYTMQDGKQVRKDFTGRIDQLTAKTEVKQTMEQKAEGKFLEGMAGVDVKRVESAIAARENALGAIEDLDRLAQLDDKNLIGGSFAEGRVGATSLLNTLGLVSGKDADRLSASEQFTKTANDLVLKAIGGKLGAGISNADRDFIKAIVPQLETSAAARRELIKYMRNLNTKVVDETTRLESYAREKRTLGGFEPKLPLGTSGRSSNLSNMSTEELKAQRDRLRGNK